MQMLNSRRMQQGWTVWGLAGMLLLISFLSLLGIKMFPPYMTNMKLNRALNKVAAEPGVGTESKREIVTRLEKMLYIDYADSDVNLNESLQIDKGKYGMTLHLNYKTTVHIAYNVSALIEFENSAKVR